MSRLLLIGAIGGILLAVATGGDAEARPHTASAPSRLLVNGAEYSLALSRQSIAYGPALIQFVNRGEDPHDLVLQKVGARSQLKFPEIRSHGMAQLEAHLTPGHYRLWCSLSGHASLGMRATLTVRR